MTWASTTPTPPIVTTDNRNNRHFVYESSLAGSATREIAPLRSDDQQPYAAAVTVPTRIDRYTIAMIMLKCTGGAAVLTACQDDYTERFASPARHKFTTGLSVNCVLQKAILLGDI